MENFIRLNHHQQLPLDVSQELVEESLTRAAHSMEKMLKIRVKPDKIEFGAGPLSPIPEFDSLDQSTFHLVKVGLDGDFKGAFYFIIDGNNVDLINSVCLPENIHDQEENTILKTHGFMSEVENAIAAWSLKVISEYLGVQLLGSISRIDIINGSGINDFLRDENYFNKTAFHVRSILSAAVVGITSYFIWMLDQNFIEKLRVNL